MGRIHLSFALVFDDRLNTTTPDNIARTIVHEASHKFARTTDVLYKHQSFDKGGAGIADLDHNLLKISVEGKVIKPMAGAKGGNLIDPIRYLENADSYAWAARRIWKKL